MRKILVSLAFIYALTFFFFGTFLVWQRTTPVKKVIAQAQNTSVSTFPVEIKIPKAGIDLPIFGSAIVHGSWQTTTYGVSYLTTSPLPGEVGNSVMYGHNWRSLLGPMKVVKPGDEIDVILADRSIRKFIVYFVSVVTPDETHIYKNTTDNRLTLYTCTGLLDSRRLVVTAILATN